jgi:hypothetical protein
MKMKYWPQCAEMDHPENEWCHVMVMGALKKANENEPVRQTKRVKK